MRKQEEKDINSPGELRSTLGILFWITDPDKQLANSVVPLPSFQAELAKVNRYIIDRPSWNEQLYTQVEETGQERIASTLITTLRLGISAEIHNELQQLCASHEKRKHLLLQRLRSAYKKKPETLQAIESTWAMLGLDLRADEPQLKVDRPRLTLIEHALFGKLRPYEVNTMSNLFNDQIYLVRSLEIAFREGLAEIAGQPSSYLEHIGLMKELVQLTHEFHSSGLTSEIYNRLLELCTKLIPQGRHVPPGSLVSDLYTLSMEFDDQIPSLPSEKAFPSHVRRAFLTGTKVAELLKQIWSNLPYVIFNSAHPSFTHLVDFLRAYRSVIHINAYDQRVDYYQQLAVWFVLFDLVHPEMDVVLLMDMLESGDDDLADVARYFFEYTKEGLQRYPTSPEEASAMFTPLGPTHNRQAYITDQAIEGFRHVFSDADQLFDVEKKLTFQQLVKTVIESDERDYISLADQGVVLSEQFGINGTHHQMRILFEENDTHAQYQISVNLNIDQFTDSEEIEDDDLSYRLRFVVSGAYESNEVMVSCPWRTSGSPELQQEIEERLVLLLTQHLMITHQADRQKMSMSTDTMQNPSSKAPEKAPQPNVQNHKAPKRKTLRRQNERSENHDTAPNRSESLSSSVNMTERQKFLPLTLELSPELQCAIERELAKDPAASPYAQLLTFIEHYNQSQGLGCIVNSRKVQPSPGTFRLRTYNEGVLDGYRFFYERKAGGVGKITGVAYRNSKTYK